MILSILDKTHCRWKITVSVDSDEEEDEGGSEVREECGNSKCSAKSENTKNSTHAIENNARKRRNETEVVAEGHEEAQEKSKEGKEEDTDDYLSILAPE